MKYVNEKVGILCAYCDFTPYSWIDYAYDEWYELEVELEDWIKASLSNDNGRIIQT